MGPTETIARYVAASRYEDLPEKVRHEAKRALLNWLGCAIGSASHETVERAVGALSPFWGAPQAALLGRGERCDILNAALLNGISSHVLDFDDTHALAVHPSAPVYPALVALAEWRGLSGIELLHAFTLGVETECRIALSVYPEHYDAGWHITATAGVFGAAAAASKMLRLDERQMRWALGIAATQSSGLREMFGTMCKSLHPGQASRNGLMAALLASRDFTSSDHIVEARRGFAAVMSTKFDPTPIVQGLGERFELLSNMYKPYPCGLVVHAAIDGCIQLKREHALDCASINRVRLGVHPLVQELTSIKAPRTELEGKFSVYHVAAVALIHGAVRESEFSETIVRDPDVVALRERVEAVVDGSIASHLEARVTIELRDGRILERHVHHALGTLDRPMSDSDLEQKFRGLVEPVLGTAESEQLIDLCWTSEKLADVGVIARTATSREKS